MAIYCELDDVYTALSAQAFVVRARKVEAADVDAATGTIRLKAHGLTEDDLVVLEVTSGGSLPTGLSAFVTYNPLPISADLFQLAASVGGPAQTFASVGAGWAVAVDSARRILKHAEWESATIDQKLVAHATPIKVDPITGKYPTILRKLAARMTARAAAVSLRVQNPEFKADQDRLFAQEEFDNAMLDGFEKNGIPLRPEPTDQTAGVADNGARGGCLAEAVDWGTTI